jgi:hypothetical protein
MVAEYDRMDLFECISEIIENNSPEYDAFTEQDIHSFIDEYYPYIESNGIGTMEIWLEEYFNEQFS